MITGQLTKIVIIDRQTGRETDITDTVRAAWADIEYTWKGLPDVPISPRYFEIECKVTWFNRWAFALPPIGCIPMYN